VEDTKATVDEIEELFGEDVADIVDGVTKISLIPFETKEEAQAENIRKMILAMAEDIRVVLVKLADRLHNMRTLEFQKPVKQGLIAQETMDIYAPLANRLGLHRIKTELEDLSFKYLKPDVYNQIKAGVDRHHTLDESYIDNVITRIRELLSPNHIRARIFGRRKHLWSVFNKMRVQGLTLDQVHDLVAFRVIVGTIRECYAVLGLVHSIWKPVPGRFKDYISLPKANMYQSLHTTVVGPGGERIEIQIRTVEMNRLAEEGVAAHWKYKEREKGKFNPKDVERFTWLRQIMDWQRELKDSREFVANLRFDLFQDEVYVFTPKARSRSCPRRHVRGPGFSHPHGRGRALRRGQGLGQARAARNAAQKRRHDRDHHGQEPASQPGLAQVRQDRQGPHPHQAFHPHRGAGALHRPRPGDARKARPQGRGQHPEGHQGREHAHRGPGPVPGRSGGRAVGRGLFAHHPAQDHRPAAAQA
jgi:ppGpp synthetase/RelA/SpoT-type nucleotidyltranferase